MNIRSLLFLSGLIVAVSGFGQTQAIVAGGSSMTQTVVIKVGPPVLSLPIEPLAPTAPFTVVTGAHLQLVATDFGFADPIATWYKDGTALPGASLTLDIPSAVPGDTGNYWATVTSRSDVNSGRNTDRAAVFVTGVGQRLLNLSTRGHIDATHPYLLSGFVVDPGPTGTWVMIRAVGPGLAAFGITDPLPTPRLRVMDGKGGEVGPWGMPTISVPGPGGPASQSGNTWQIAGAFPLPAGGKDVAAIYYLPAGAYSVTLSSEDGSSGIALLEIYELR